MGFFCVVRDKENRKCPKCGKSLITPVMEHMGRSFVEWQTKDLSGEWENWDIGDHLSIWHGNVKFVAKPFNAVWTGCASCMNFEENCRAFLECDIIIEEGVIKRIENIREKTFDD